MLSLDPEVERQIVACPLSPSKMAHVVFRTAKFGEMVDFWKKLLNARPTFENEHIAFLSFDHEHHRVAIVNMPSLDDDPRLQVPGFEHVAFTYHKLGHLLSTYRRLKEHELDPIWCINHGVTTSIYYADPDGNKIELQYDNLDNSGADAFMHSGYFSINPIGVDFDPERLIERYLRGDPIDEIIRQGSALPPPGIEPPQPELLIPYDRRGELLNDGPERI